MERPVYKKVPRREVNVSRGTRTGRRTSSGPPEEPHRAVCPGQRAPAPLLEFHSESVDVLLRPRFDEVGPRHVRRICVLRFGRDHLWGDGLLALLDPAAVLLQLGRRLLLRNEVAELRPSKRWVGFDRLASDRRERQLAHDTNPVNRLRGADAAVRESGPVAQSVGARVRAERQ